MTPDEMREKAISMLGAASPSRRSQESAQDLAIRMQMIAIANQWKIAAELCERLDYFIAEREADAARAELSTDV